jgi:hypothetical protein
MDWLIGDWQRTQTKENQMTYEDWHKSGDSLYIGNSCTLEGVDTVWQESMQLIKIRDYWRLDITAKGEETATRFPLSKVDKNTFTAENALNPFPNKIEYRRTGDQLSGKVSGKEDSLLFEFRKRE